jgi:hypothetical protein
LREDAVVVADAVTRRGVAERGERIEKACRQAAQAAVAEPRILLLGSNVFEIVPERLQRLAHLVHEPVVERGERIDQAAPEQELHREVADALDACARDAIERGDPALGELLAHCNRQRVVEIATRRALHRLTERTMQAIDDRLAHAAGLERDGTSDGRQ